MDKSCTFCLIASRQGKKVIKQTNELVCFRDICPAAPHHYLVIPKEHIVSCLSLDSGHISLVERMAEMGKAVLLEQGITDLQDISLGFHLPPYISVNHLHLHVLAPASKISPSMKFKFTPGTKKFVKEDHLRKQLNRSKCFLGSCWWSP